MKHRHALAALMPLLLLLGGCGNERREPPDLEAVGGGGSYERFTSAGGAVSFRYPASWVAADAAEPQVAQVTTGGALAAIFAYPRTDLRTDPAGVRAQRKRLIESLRRRAPGFLVLDTRLTRVDGAPAVEIRGRGEVGGRPVETRAVHVFEDAVEYVVDAYARPDAFEKANRVGFAPLLASLELSGRPVPGQSEAD
jgi:hypothetical protein